MFPSNVVSHIVSPVFASAALALGSNASAAPGACDEIAAALGGDVYLSLTAALNSGVSPRGGLGNEMWGTIVDRQGIVCAVAFSGPDLGSQWMGSRVISAQKANTAVMFSLPAGAGGAAPGLAFSTANLWAAKQPGGSLFGLQHSNPVNPAVAYGDNGSASSLSGDTIAAPRYGDRADPLVGEYIGGINVFGGGLALYAEGGRLLGALGVSGDTSCTDHVVAWRARDTLGLDHVPNGVSPTGDDNIMFDVVPSSPGSSGFEHFQSESGFGHPECGFGERAVAEALPETHPTE